MNDRDSTASSWLLDSSTFINAAVVDRLPLMLLLRSPIFFPEYVFRFELGTNARQATRQEAVANVTRKRIGVQNLTLADLDTIAAFNAPRRIGLGELACAVIANRLGGGVLCDDWRAKAWLNDRMATPDWDSIESVLLEAAARNFIGETDLAQAQRTLEENRYKCRYDLQIEHVRRNINACQQNKNAIEPSDNSIQNEGEPHGERAE